jgi:hypothetical protein
MRRRIFIRWTATISYHSEQGRVDIEHHLEELTELPRPVERRPHRGTIENVVIIKALLQFAEMNTDTDGISIYCDGDAQTVTIEEFRQMTIDVG